MKHISSLLRSIKYCSISPNLICKGGNIMRPLDISGTFITFRLPGTKASLKDQSFLVRCSDLALLSHKYMKQRC